MSDPPKDWDKELAKIDRAMARMPRAGADPAPARKPPGAAVARVPPASATHVGPRATTTTWLRVLLVLTLALAMPLWPYPKGCGVGLYAYLAAAGDRGAGRRLGRHLDAGIGAAPSVTSSRSWC